MSWPGFVVGCVVGTACWLVSPEVGLVVLGFLVGAAWRWRPRAKPEAVATPTEKLERELAEYFALPLDCRLGGSPRETPTEAVDRSLRRPLGPASPPPSANPCPCCGGPSTVRVCRACLSEVDPG